MHGIGCTSHISMHSQLLNHHGYSYIPIYMHVSKPPRVHVICAEMHSSPVHEYVAMYISSYHYIALKACIIGQSSEVPNWEATICVSPTSYHADTITDNLQT